MERLYFAYGSNLLTQRLTARCPTARAVGRAQLPGYRVGFAKYSWIDGSGKATLLPAPEATALGVVYKLSEADLTELDRIEGVGKGYDRHDTLPVTIGGAPVAAAAYVATDPSERLRPFDWYLALILAGARQHDLGDAAVASLATEGFDRDPEPERPGRMAAITALEAAGHPDWERLLPAPTGSG